LREILLSNEHVYVSKTDTEVIPHLIEEEMKRGQGLEAARSGYSQASSKARMLSLLSVRGSRIRLSVRRNHSPLIIGVSDKGLFLKLRHPCRFCIH